MQRKTITNIKSMKGNEKITSLTCYTYFNAKIFDEIGVDIVLIGDSLGNVILGYENTLKVEVDDIIYHSQIVARGNKTSLLVADMPFMSYQSSVNSAIENAGNIIKYGEVNAVKLEGGSEIKDQIKAIIDIGIPVMGHLGLKPQSVNAMGGYKVQGKTEDDKKQILKDALLLQDLGVFAIVFECIPENLAKEITKELKIPTIGIGSGRYCDGQVLVFDDMIGMTNDKPKKFVKSYSNVGHIIRNSAKEYVQDVKDGKFPTEENVILKV
jgi:3-methyl-2-oxobutanoate hydroxymethyltransferase